MRIAYICADTGIPIFGNKGSSIHVQEIIRALLAQNIQVELFAIRINGAPPPQFEGLTVHSIPFLSKKGDRASEEQTAIDANHYLRDLLEGKGPYDMIYERYSLWSFAGMEYARDKGIPGVLEVNAPLIEEQARYRQLINRSGAGQITQKVFEDATVLIAVSGEVAAYVKKFVSKKVHIVRNAVNSHIFQDNIEPSCPGGNGIFTIGFVGTLKPWHGLPTLVEAYSLLHRKNPNIRLLIVGDGPQRKDLIGDLSSHGLLKKAHLTGLVSHSEIPGLLASMDAAVAPYPQQSDFYFSPLKVFEYMAAGLPVVASRAGQLEELIQHGVNGLLCPPDDPQALADSLEQLSSEPILCAQLGQMAKEIVFRDHTWEIVARRILHLAAIKNGG